MPVAIPAIAAAAASYGAGVLIAEAVAAGTISALGASIITGAAGLAASMAVGAILAPHVAANSNLLGTGGGRTQQVRQPITAHKVVFGRVKTSGAWMFAGSGPDDTGRADGYFYVQLVVASHQCREIGDVYLNDVLSTDVRYSGQALVTIGRHRGTPDQVEDPTFLADLGSVFLNHWLRGRANIAVRLKGSAAAFPSGLPNISVIVYGVDDTYDPRRQEIAWSNNAAICIARWFTAPWGMNLAFEDLDFDSLIAAANVCDERVLVNPRPTTFTADAATNQITMYATARKLDAGDGVRFTSDGTLPSPLFTNTTYYAIPTLNDTIKLASTTENAIRGNAFEINDAGTGNHVLTAWDEARYKMNGEFTLDAAKRDVLEQLLSSMAGIAVYIGGKWFIHAGAAAAPSVTLDEDDLRSDFSTTPKRSLRDKFNGVRAVYVSPDDNWQPVDAPPLLNPTYVAEDDGEELIRDVRFPFTTSARTVQRLMKIELERNRRQRTVNFPAKLTGFRLQVWDGAWLNNDRYGWDQMQFRVAGWALTEEGGIDLSLAEDDAAVYAWDASEEQTVAEPAPVTLPDASSIAAPATVTITAITTSTYPRIDAVWDEVKSIWLDGYDVEYRASGGSTWSNYGRIGASSSLVAQIERTSATDLQVRAVTKNGSVSTWTQNLAPAMPTGASATGAVGQINLAWTNGAGSATVQIFSNTTNDFATSTLLTTASGTTFSNTGLGAGATRFYWLRSKNIGNNISAQTASVTATSS